MKTLSTLTLAFALCLSGCGDGESRTDFGEVDSGKSAQQNGELASKTDGDAESNGSGEANGNGEANGSDEANGNGEANGNSEAAANGNGDAAANGSDDAATNELPEEFDEKRLATNLFDLLVEVITGKADAEDREKLEERVELMLETERLGTLDDRIIASQGIIDQVIEEMTMAGLLGRSVTTELSGYQKAATREVARALAGDAIVRFTGGGVGEHDGSLASAVEIEVPEGYVKGDWSALGSFDYKEGMELPAVATAFDDKKVAFGGYMMSLGEYTDVRKFLLVESIWSCCFGIPPDVHQVIVVKIPKEYPSTELTSMAVRVLGTLDVGEERDGRWVTSIYRLEATSVEEVE